MKIKVYTEDFSSLWDRFVQDSRNGTFMQKRAFLNYHPADRFQDQSLLVFNRKEHLLAVLPAAIRKENDHKILLSHPGASHGGIIVGHNVKSSCVTEIVGSIKKYAQAEKIDAIQLKMVPRIYHKWPCDEIDFALRHHGFKIINTELATAIPLPFYHDKKADSSTLRNIRKAVKNQVEVKETPDIDGYWQVLTKNLKLRHSTKPTHSYEEIVDLMKRFKDKIKIFAAYQNNKLIAGTVVFILNERVINCFYIAHDEHYQSVRPLNLVFDYLIKWGKERNFTYLDWGISTEQGGKVLNSGLINFKEGFGGRGVLRETYRLNLS
ncbi:GNAT family N-acetyltransferase [Peptococcaceae bacterium 1198_IL3148]